MAFGLKKKEVSATGVKPDSKKMSLKDIVDGKAVNDFLKNQVGLIAFILFLVFFYISNRYECEHKLVEIVKLESKLEDVKYESLSRSAELLGGSKQSEVKALIVEKTIPLVESETPPYSLKDSTTKGE